MAHLKSFWPTLVGLLLCLSLEIKVNGADVTGIVIDSITGQPLSGATVIIVQTADTAYTDGAGRYFVANVPDGVYSFLIGYTNHTPRILAAVTVGNCCQHRGNVDGIIGPAGPVDVSDLTFLVAFLFSGGAAPPCTDEASVDGVTGPAGPIDVSDLTFLVAFLFSGGAAPPPCA
ncbi:MAG TPA: carboxypeptidase regulatory-like domain-containing protein [Candidatus Deferrimicrobium sp.]|nr:carboxypeptidase regulatory-like domain-containing protein [Candidatus Deferrimicrobium sp.]